MVCSGRLMIFVFFCDVKVVLLVLIILYFMYRWFFFKFMYLLFWLGIDILIGVFFVLKEFIGLYLLK